MTNRSTTMTLEDAVQEALDGRTSMILCPAHEDRAPSLSVSPGQRQPVILNCHAGCEPDEIIGAGGVDWATVCDPLDGVEVKSKGEWTPAGEASNVYAYHDADGTLVYEVLRVPQPDGGKRIMQRRPDATKHHGHAWNLEGVKRTIWRLPQVIEAVANGHTIHIAEGEKCVEWLLGAIPAGDEATCNSGGAGKWLPEFSEHLAGANVIIYADADDPGRAHAREVRESLLVHDCTVTLKEAPPGVMRSGKAITDVADHLETGFPLDTLLVTTPEEAEKKARTGTDVLDLVTRPRTTVDWAIDGTLAKGERLVLIGFEGTGKSELLRQMAVCSAAGLHPFTGARLAAPRRVLFIDPENHPDQTQDRWAHLVGLCARLDAPVERGMLTIMEEWESERDIDTAAGEAWFLERIHAYKPDLVVMGPLTNMSSRDLRDDEPVRRIRNAVNRARAICNSAFIMEHHAPLKGSMDKERPMRPYGSSLLLKWPDYGYGIKPTDDPKVYSWSKTRGPRVRSRAWPAGLREGAPGSLEFPWMECVPE